MPRCRPPLVYVFQRLSKNTLSERLSTERLKQRRQRRRNEARRIAPEASLVCFQVIAMTCPSQRGTERIHAQSENHVHPCIGLLSFLIKQQEQQQQPVNIMHICHAFTGMSWKKLVYATGEGSQASLAI